MALSCDLDTNDDHVMRQEIFVVDDGSWAVQLGS